MFKWFKRNQNQNQNKTIEDLVEEKFKNNTNYHELEDGSIRIKYEYDSYDSFTTFMEIPKDSIVSHTEDTIIVKDYRNCFNLNVRAKWGNFEISCPELAIDKKENFITYKQTYFKTYVYDSKHKFWKFVNKEFVSKEIESEKTPREIFEENECKYKLIEGEEEFDEYLKSKLDADTWSRKKLYNKMRELGLGNGFIEEFSDLIGNDLKKYHTMINLASEVSDPDTLMYLYVYKFKKK